MKHQHIILLLCVLNPASFKRQPNIVFILTDDQDIVLNGMTPMTKVRELIAKEGVTFTNAFTTTPICCPSRSSILTGLYIHSHRTVNNSLSGGCSSHHWQKVFEPRTYGKILHDVGYRTFYAGKYLNKYGFKPSRGVKHVPVGWDWWIGLVGNSVYYNYTLSVNGTGVYRGDADTDYLTDVLKEYSLMFLNQKQVQEEPFLMVINTPSPHEPFTPATRHKGRFSGMKAPRTHNFNVPTQQTKHWLLRLPPEVLPPEVVDTIDEIFENRWETLLAVDELVGSIVNRLADLNVLKDTYIIYSSDHGFHLGQFGLPWDKRQLYETDIRIPLLIRGPDIYKKTINNPVLNIDIAPTIFDMAEVSPPYHTDGESFLRHINSLPTSRSSRSFLVEYHGEHGNEENDNCYKDPEVKLCELAASCKCFDGTNNTFTCVRRLLGNVDDIYCEFKDNESFIEAYNLKTDPFQLDNLSGRGDFTTQKRILKCCRKMTELNKPVNECFQ